MYFIIQVPFTSEGVTVDNNNRLPFVGLLFPQGFGFVGLKKVQVSKGIKPIPR